MHQQFPSPASSSLYEYDAQRSCFLWISALAIPKRRGQRVVQLPTDETLASIPYFSKGVGALGIDMLKYSLPSSNCTSIRLFEKQKVRDRAFLPK
jgi:hypothetical protein